MTDPTPTHRDIPEPARILIVDDEAQIIRVLSMACTAQGYRVKSAADGEAALAVLKSWPAELIVTDLSMPKMDGVELCRAIRKQSSVPILVLSVRSQEKMKVEALDAGADDYVTKPFQINELLARVRAALRRQRRSATEDKAAEIVVGNFRIDPRSRQVFVLGTEVHLTPKEFDLLHIMSLSPDRVITRRALMVAVWGGYNVDQPESLRVLIAQLRRKIEPRDGPRYILTEPWVGYRFVPEQSPSNPSL
ncbi:MAG: response regulator transcription factor [Acidobacteriaceae bacterium]